MPGPTESGFYELTGNPDIFQMTSGLLTDLPGGLLGLDGGDFITGSEDDEIINGNRDNDIIFSAEGNDTLYGGKDVDLLSGGQGADFLQGNLGNDQLLGERGDDILRGGKDNDSLVGGAGNDRLFGDLGIDTLTGGEGNDVFVLSDKRRNNDLILVDIINDFEPGDRLGLAGDLTAEDLTPFFSAIPGGSGTFLRINETGENLAFLFDVAPEDINEGVFVGVDEAIADTDDDTADDDTTDDDTTDDDTTDDDTTDDDTADDDTTDDDTADDDTTDDDTTDDDTADDDTADDDEDAADDDTADDDTADDDTADEDTADETLESSSIQTEPLTEEAFRISLDALPPAFETDSASNPAQVIPVPENAVLEVPQGFTVNVFADNLDSPRWLATTPTGDVLVTETPQNQIRLLRDTDGNGTADTSQIFAGPENGLNQPFGMAFTEDFFYVGNTDAAVRFPYTAGQTEISGTGEKIADLPTGGHWTRNLALSPDGQQLFVSVGSLSNAAPEPAPRASVIVMNLDGSNQEIFASGLRNPVGLDFHPVTGELYTTVNERDGLGDELVPDYLTALEAGEFYGWPYTYLAPELADPRLEGETSELVGQTQTPDVLFQSHSAPLGLDFYDGSTFPETYQNGAFVAFRGSWNRSEPTGYKVAFVPFDSNGNPTGEYRDFVTGFLDADAETTWGRPTGVKVIDDGSLLFTEENNGRIYRVQFS